MYLFLWKSMHKSCKGGCTARVVSQLADILNTQVEGKEGVEVLKLAENCCLMSDERVRRKVVATLRMK